MTDFDEQYCGCIINNDWPDGVYSCSSECETSAGTFRCSRPTDHDGPHAACSPVEHPALVWWNADEHSNTEQQ